MIIYMNGFIILTSMVFVAFIVYKITKNRILKYILPPIASILYGFLLFFVGMGISGVLYVFLAIAPVIVGLHFIIEQIFTKKKPR
jgi:hypothetical protein